MVEVPSDASIAVITKLVDAVRAVIVSSPNAVDPFKSDLVRKILSVAAMLVFRTVTVPAVSVA
jgi:uroporphyrinogen-III synthase